MIRNLKMFGMAIVAVFAMSAVAASMASADSFTAEKAPVTYTGNQSEANVFTTTVGTVKCTVTTFKGTVNSTSTTTASVTPTYSGCTAFGFPADIEVNGCEYLLHVGAATTGTVDVVCPVGKEITVVATTSATNPTPKCIVHIKAQSGLGTVTYSNVGTGTTREVLVSVNVSGIHYTHTPGSGLGACPTEGTSTTGTYTGSVLVTGESGATHVGIFLS